MGFSRALALLHALLHAHEGAAGARRLLASDDKAAPPFPHLQQRLRQTARGAALTAGGAVAAPLALLTLVPAASPWAFPGVIGFSALGALLVALAVLQVALRFVLLPAPRQALTADPLTAMQGVAQTAACALVDVAAPLHRDPQLLLLLLFCVAQTWVWKTALYYVALPSDAAADDFGSFVLISGLVTFVSWLAVEPRLDQDPFVLDPRSSFLHALQRDVVRAARRGVVSYFAARLMLVVFGASLSVSGILGQIFTINLARAFFQITTSFLESFAALATASIFRILLFRANYAAVAAAATGGKLWDIVGAHVKAQSGITTLFTKDLDVSTNAAAGLDEQYVSALGKRTDSVMKAVARTDALSIGSGSGSDKSVEDMNALFAFENLLLSSKFNTDNRKTLYSSHKRWHSLFQSTTAVIDSFTVSLQLLNSIPTRKNQVAPNDSQAFEQSVVVLLKFLAKNSEADPLLLLHQYPHLSNLRISSSGFKSKIRYYVESRIQFAVRRFLMQEAKRHIFRAARGVEAAQVLLCHLVSKSRNEDVQGNVKYTVPAAMASLVECRKALDAYMESCLKDDSSTDIYIKEAATLAKGIDNGVYKLTNAFYAELHAFTFPSGISGALASYAAFTA